MIDSHTHLTYPQLADRLDTVLQNARQAGVTGMITIGTDIADAGKAIALCRQHPHIRCAIGIHPHHSAEATDAHLTRLAELEADPVVLALGEMGLDYHYDFSPRDVQKRVFLAQLDIARRRNRPIVIHCREAIDDCLAILRDFPAIRADFHCFTGFKSEARRILDLGHMIGLTGVVTYKKSDELREIAAFIPDAQLLVETDAPYLAPEPVRKQKNNEPAFVIHTAAAIARIRGVTLQKLDEITTTNIARFFGWSAAL
ncbi:MAG: TatD family hydrolase [Tepidisphaeraceae bacterium]|jgi:TatD DNase family protein